MIKVKIYSDATTYVEYSDILDLDIDPKGCSGVGFMSQEARMAELSLLLDAWLTENILNGLDIGMQYLALRAVILRDENIIFSGFLKCDADIIVPEECESTKILKIRIYDPFWVILDFAEGLEFNLYEFDPFPPITALPVWLEWVQAAMPAYLALYIVVSDDYNELNWEPYYAAGAPLFSFSDPLTVQPEYANVERRSLVMYVEDDELYLEYCLHDSFTVLAGFEGYINADHYQHFIWSKYHVFNATTVGRLIRVETSNEQTRDDSTILPDTNPATIAAWIANLPSYFDNYPVTDENGLTEVRMGAQGYVLTEGNFSQTYHPREEVRPLGPDENDDEEAILVDALTFIEDMTKILCAWLDADGFVLRIKNRMVLPAESNYSVNADELKTFRKVKGNNSSLSMDCSYLANGDALRDGLERYYNEVFSERMPYGFELDVYLADHVYEVGEVIDYDGWLMMIIEIKEDIYGHEAQLVAVGGKL